MPVPVVAGNWKMNTSVREALKLARDMVEALDSVAGVEKVMCPPFVWLEAVSKVIQGSSVKLGAQNMYHEPNGAYTGEISPTMLAGLCQYVILGHSERRQHFGEADALVNLKVKAALEAGLRPIMCVGETLEQRQQGKAGEIIEEQIEAGLEGLHNIDTLVVAYEPVWAIGTGVSATPETASEMMGGVILGKLGELYGEQAAVQVPLLYGGSVNPENIEGFVREESVHGALVGGASLNAAQFAKIVRITAKVKNRL